MASDLGPTSEQLSQKILRIRSKALGLLLKLLGKYFLSFVLRGLPKTYMYTEEKNHGSFWGIRKLDSQLDYSAHVHPGVT